ncbi:MAG: ABC transporter permease [Pseudomonadales bacterium]|nr:ABC transporter permease [Pseudomonadales bacterium]
MTQSSATPVSQDEFAPLQRQQQQHRLVRPSRTYWQDAWLRLKTNTRALVSLYLVMALAFFTLVGPLLWTVDPNSQDVDQISQPPGADRRAMVVPAFTAWEGALPADSAADGLQVLGPATTQSVRLHWEVMPGAAAYRLYRTLFPVGEERAFGLPLIDFPGEQQTWYEDRLDLRARTYYYSLVELDENNQPGERFQTLAVPVQRVVTRNEVAERNLLAAAEFETLQAGDEVLLTWHPLGTDYLGRDMLARLMAGARVSLFIGVVAPALFVLFGVLYGSMAGFVGGRADQVLMRFADFVVALPFLLFMILFQVVFGIGPGESGIVPMLIALVVLSWPATARLVRGQIMQIRQEAYISAARLLGGSRIYLILRHMIPNTMGVILVTLTFAVPSAIFTEAFLSFIGMGVAPPAASWGSMCNEGLKTMLTHPHELIFPALLISITVLAFNLLGDGLRDALDARMRNSE